MKNLLSEYDINVKLLTPKEEQQINSMYETRKEMLANKVRWMRDELLQREELILDSIAKKAGFDGYDKGDFNYVEQERKTMLGEAVDTDTHERIRMFGNFKLFDEEYGNLVNDSKKLQQYERDENNWLKQVYYNDVLTATRHRAEKYTDEDNKPLLSAKAYNELSKKDKKHLEKVNSRTVGMNDGTPVELDDMIARQIQWLWNMGIQTNASCSGMVKDHPYHRYGRWKKGENMFNNKVTCHAYISLPMEGNDPELMRQVEAKALDWGWTIERQSVYGKDSLVLRPQHTLDGLSLSQVNEEVDGLVEDIFHQYGMESMTEARLEAVKNVEYDHGGKIPYTDKLLGERWSKLTDSLRYIKNDIDRKTLQKNIEEGKAFKFYYYDSDKVKLSADQLAAVFHVQVFCWTRIPLMKPCWQKATERPGRL